MSTFTLIGPQNTFFTEQLLNVFDGSSTTDFTETTYTFYGTAQNRVVLNGQYDIDYLGQFYQGTATSIDIYDATNHKVATITNVSIDSSDFVPLAIRGGAFYDFMGLLGDIELFGGAGDDYLYGSAGNDTAHGGAGNDLIETNGGPNPGGNANYAYGDAGNDSIRAYGDGDVLDGGADVDWLRFDATLVGTNLTVRLDSTRAQTVAPGITITAKNFENTQGGAGADNLYGTRFNNILSGGYAYSGNGWDTLHGGLGDDTYLLDDTPTLSGGGNAYDIVDETANAGIDTVKIRQGSINFYGLTANVENIQVVQGAMSLAGNELGNVMTGYFGDDTIDGLAGNDTIIGGAGNDSMFGGADIDTLDYSTSNSGAINANLLTGTVTSGSYTDSVSGFERIIGTIYADTLTGSTGADTLTGGAGADVYYVDNIGDKIVEAANGGVDKVFSSVTFTLAAEVDNLELTGSTAINGVGNALANLLIGNSAANKLIGGVGADTMQGGGGNDTYYVDNVGDRVIEAANAGIDKVYSAVSYTLAAEVERLELTGTVAVNAIGNTLANIIIGNSVANKLFGGLGSDTITGGAGADTFYFTTALGTSNVDHLTDFSVADDTIQLSKAVVSAITGTGTLTASQFVANATGVATNTSQHIIYNTSTGQLFYDSNGSDSGGSTLFAVIDNRTTAGTLTNADFFIA